MIYTLDMLHHLIWIRVDSEIANCFTGFPASFLGARDGAQLVNTRKNTWDLETFEFRHIQGVSVASKCQRSDCN